MNTPKNCRECKHAADCKSYYGGTSCLHEKAINEMRRKTP